MSPMKSVQLFVDPPSPCTSSAGSASGRAARAAVTYSAMPSTSTDLPGHGASMVAGSGRVARDSRACGGVGAERRTAATIRTRARAAAQAVLREVFFAAVFFAAVFFAGALLAAFFGAAAFLAGARFVAL